MATAIFGGGCFWCTEAAFKALPGVGAVVPGYAGGHTDNPSYSQVCAGDTGHAEVVKVEYDPEKVSYRKLLGVFFSSHDPTSLNRQGADTGTQYRSIILFETPEQEKEAKQYAAELLQKGVISKPVATQIVPLDAFWQAEDYHMNYYARNRNAPYCQAVIRPKLEKLEEHLKKEGKPDQNG